MSSNSAKRSVLLVELYWTRAQDPRTPLGLASLLASTQAHPNIDAHALAIPVNEAGPTCRLAKTILAVVAERPGGESDIAIGTYVWAEHIIQELLPELRRRGFRGRIILGGPQISYAGPGLETLYPDADVFVRGYGETALRTLIVDPDAQIRGVHRAGQFDDAQQAKCELNQLPSPWLTGVVPLQGQRFVRWETQRGCPYRCSFCQHREPGARLRRRALARDRIDEEIQLFSDTGVDNIAVLDPIFNLGSHALEVFDQFLRCRYTGRLSLQCRLEQVNEPFVELASRLDVTLEFGLQTIHDSESKAVKRHNRLAKAEKALERVLARGIHAEVSLIFGLPTQTLASFRESVQWALDARVPTIKAFPLMLLRGTPLSLDRAHWGLVDDADPMPVVVASNSFNENDWRHMAAIAAGLRATEGSHPPSVLELEGIGITRPLNFALWRPG